MAHGSHGSSEHVTHSQMAWEWWLVLLAGLVAAAFGAWGQSLWEIAHGGTIQYASIGYHTLQLFTLDGAHLEGHVPWQLELGRWLSAMVVLGAVARGLAVIFWSEVRLFWIRFRGGHIVICGLGKMGMRLATEFRRQKLNVVAIDISDGAELLTGAYQSGMAVVRGDASRAETLRSAGIGRAAKVIATCDDDQKNVGVAAAMGRLLQGRLATSAVAAECWLFVGDAQLRQALRRHGVFPHTDAHFQVNVRGLDYFELAARRAFERFPLDQNGVRPGDATVVHLVIVGFGSMGQQLALQAGRIGHFANFKQLRVTVVERRESRRAANFLLRYSKFKDICDFNLVELSAGEPLDCEAAVQAVAGLGVEGETVTVAACWENAEWHGEDESDFFKGLGRDDATNLALAFELTREAAQLRKILVFQTREDGFATLFPAEGRGQAIGVQLFPFGMIEDIWSLETLLHEREDGVARALHKDYFDKQIQKGRNVGDRPAIQPWEKLEDRFRDSNRRAADFIGVKLRAIGCVIDEKRQDVAALSAFEPAQVELLAKMEHESWCAEWYLQGYTYGVARDDLKKIQPSLVSWDQLTEEIRDYDREQIAAIPGALRSVGCYLYASGALTGLRSGHTRPHS